MAEPPSDTGAVNVTLADVSPPVAVPMVGAPGAVAAAAVGPVAVALLVPVPTALTAATR